MKKIAVLFWGLAVCATAAFAQPALNVSVEACGDNAITVGPNCAVPYYVVGELTDVPNRGLALVGFDLDFDGGALAKANEPTSGPMTAFVKPDGITNPEGYGGTPTVDGNLLQAGGGQNTIMNGQVPCVSSEDCPAGSDCQANNLCEPVAAFPTGTVFTDIAKFGDPQVLLTGELTAPAAPGTYNLNLANLFANVIRDGETGIPFWATQAIDDENSNVVPLTITVQAGQACPVQALISVPPSGAIDARQPTETNNANTKFGWDSVDLTFQCIGITGLAAEDIGVTEHGGVGSPPVVLGVSPLGPNAVTVEFNKAMRPGTWLEIEVAGLTTCLGYLPGDAGQDGTSNPADIDALIAELNDDALPAYATDINRSESANAQDILRLVDVLNGAAAFAPGFNGQSLPASPCP